MNKVSKTCWFFLNEQRIPIKEIVIYTLRREVSCWIKLYPLSMSCLHDWSSTMNIPVCPGRVIVVKLVGRGSERVRAMRDEFILSFFRSRVSVNING